MNVNLRNLLLITLSYYFVQIVAIKILWDTSNDFISQIIKAILLIAISIGYFLIGYVVYKHTERFFYCFLSISGILFISLIAWYISYRSYLDALKKPSGGCFDICIFGPEFSWFLHYLTNVSSLLVMNLISPDFKINHSFYILTFIMNFVPSILILIGIQIRKVVPPNN